MPRTVPAVSDSHLLRILHLSDLHIRGPRETERERRTRVLGANWMANLAELRKEGPFDFVVFTGDIAFGGALDEYLELMWRPREDGTAAAWLDETLAAVGCTRANLYVVPGNHDIDRTVHPAAWQAVRATWSSAGADDDRIFARWIVRGGPAPRGIDTGLRDQVFARQSAYRIWLTHGLGRPDLLPDPQRSHLGYRATVPAARLPFPVHIIGLDSAWLAGDEHDARKLRLTDDQILRLCTNSDGEHLTGLRLALVHHPLAELADGPRAQRLLQEHGIGLLLSGHLHEPDAREIRSPEGTLRDLATGCLYQHDRYPNAVTVLTLTLDDVGRIHKIAFRFRGWSERGHWHDDNSLYKGTSNGRLSWSLTARAQLAAPYPQAEPTEVNGQQPARSIASKDISVPQEPMSGPGSDTILGLFESHWASRAALDVLRGATEAIRLALFGAEDEGIELQICCCEHVEFHIVKGRPPSPGRWTMTALLHAGVLHSLYDKLQDSRVQCTFVSPHPAAALGELSDSARAIRSSKEHEPVLSIPVALKTEFEILRSAWGDIDDTVALGLLCRIHVVTIGDETLRRRLIVDADGILEGDRTSIFPTLVRALVDHRNRLLTAHHLWRLLSSVNYKPAVRNRPSQAGLHITAANAKFVASRTSTLILGKPLPRHEADLLSDAVAAHRLVLLDGIAGMGKSDVLLQFTDLLGARKIPYLVFRIDRLTPTRRPEDVGLELDLPSSPTATLAALAQGNEAVLVIDQLDAVSSISGRNPPLLECVTEIIRSAHAIPNLRIVLVCRTFDLENDAHLRQLVALEKDRKTITVGPLDRVQLQATLLELGYGGNALSDSQLELLRVPLHLALLAEATTTSEKQLDFSTPLDLYNTFWLTKRRGIDDHFGSSSWVEVINRLIDYMSSHQVLRAPAITIDNWEQYGDAMVSAHVLTRDGQQLAFFHETFFDYAFARSSIARGFSVSSLLAQDQFLFRRAQVRQLLAHERQCAPIEYKRDLSYLVRDASVRFHMKDVVMSWLSQLVPTLDEWSLVERLLVDEHSALCSRAWRILASPDWFHFADQRGFVEKRLHTEDHLIERMVAILGYAVKSQPERVASLLMPFVEEQRWRARVLSVTSQADLGTARSIFDLFAKCAAEGPADSASKQADDFGYGAQLLAKSRPDWACEFLGQYIRERSAAARRSGFDDPFDEKARAFPSVLDLRDLIQVISSAAPIDYIQHVWPHVVEIISRTSRDVAPNRLRSDSLLVLHHLDVHEDLPQSLIAGAERAFQLLAQREPGQFDKLVAEHRYTSHETIVYLLYRGFVANARRYANTAIEFLVADARRFNVRYSNSDYWATRQLLEAVTPHATSDSLSALEVVLLNLSTGLQMDEYTQFALIGGIDRLRRSPAARKRFAELRRKFQIDDAVPPKGLVGGMIRSPIPAEAAQKMNNEQWAGAITKYAAGYRDIDRRRDFLKGGAEQLAQVLEEETKRDPSRFARLALELGDNANCLYFTAILRGVADAAEQLSLASVQALIERCHRLPKHPCGRWIARPLRRFAANEFPSNLVDIVNWYAINDPDPEADPDPDGERHDERRLDLVNSGLNSVRGGIAADIACFIEGNTGHLPSLDDAIQHLATDRVTAVRAMAAEIIFALVSTHPSRARELFLQLIESSDDRLLITHYVYHYLLQQGVADFTSLSPLIERMIHSTFSSVRTHGAIHISLTAFTREDARALADACITSDDESLRIGATKVYMSNLTVPQYTARCSAALRRFFDDPSVEVRKIAADSFWRMNSTQLGAHAELARAFLESAAFELNANELIHALTETTAAVPDLILEVCKRTLDAFENTRQGSLGHQAVDAIGLVLRAYADSDERSKKDQALDLIDRSLKLDIYGMSKNLAEHDRWWGNS